MVINLENSFILNFKHLQIILTLVLNHFIDLARL